MSSEDSIDQCVAEDVDVLAHVSYRMLGVRVSFTCDDKNSHQYFIDKEKLTVGLPRDWDERLALVAAAYVFIQQLGNLLADVPEISPFQRAAWLVKHACPAAASFLDGFKDWQETFVCVDISEHEKNVTEK